MVPFNDIGAIEAALASGEVACVLAEPALTNIGIVLPAPGFHEALRAACSATGTLLVIDETHTICAGPGGATAAWGLQPDLLTIGKPIGGGMPAAAYGMTAAVAEGLSSLMAAEGVDVSGIGGTLTGQRARGRGDEGHALVDPPGGGLRRRDPAGLAMGRRRGRR